LIHPELAEYADMIEGRAISSGLRASLISALIMVESGGRRYAWRPEPRYHYLWDIRRGSPFRPLTRFESASESPPADFPAPRGTSSTAEWWGQQASWGLMQIMGAVAREQGLQGPDLPVLCDPAINLGIGNCRCLVVVMRYILLACPSVDKWIKQAMRSIRDTASMLSQEPMPNSTSAAAG